MRSATVLLILSAGMATALPAEIKRAPAPGLDMLNSLGGKGNDPLTMLKSLPDKNVDPSPLGLDNTVSHSPLSAIKRDVPMLNNFIPLDKNGSPLSAVSQGQGHRDLVDIQDNEVLGPILQALGLDEGKLIKKDLRRSRAEPEEKTPGSTWHGADELDDENDEPQWV